VAAEDAVGGVGLAHGAFEKYYFPDKCKSLVIKI
jgi:hypothetical protein